MAIYNSTPYLEGSDNQVVPISKDTVLKGECVWESAYAEALAMDLVREQTSIPIPHMRKLMCVNGDGLILMDLVKNAERLETVWPSLSFWNKFKIVLAIRLYTRQLRRIEYAPSSNVPGPLGPVECLCNGL